MPDQTFRFRGVPVQEYRTLEQDEILEATDELMGARIHGGEFFMPIRASHIGRIISEGDVGLYRRPI
jgi:hypothetical protein